MIAIEKELDTIYDLFNDLFEFRSYEQADWIIRSIDSQLDINTVLGVLAASYPAKSKLPSRVGFYEKAKRRFGFEMVKGLE